MTRIHSLTLISQPPWAPSDAKWTTACPFHFSHGSQKKHCPSVRWQAVCFDISTSVCDRRESDVPKRSLPPEGHCPGLAWPERWRVCGKSLALKAQGRETSHPQDPARMARRASSGERIHASRLPGWLARNTPQIPVSPCQPAHLSTDGLTEIRKGVFFLCN